MDDTRRSMGWVAGLLEGEGTFRFQKGLKQGYLGSPIVACNMTDEDILVALKNATGVGKLYGPYTTRTRPRQKPMWLWTVRGADAISLMDDLFPLMGERRQRQILTVRATPLRRAA